MPSGRTAYVQGFELDRAPTVKQHMWADIMLRHHAMGDMAMACFGTGLAGRGCVGSARRAEGGPVKDTGRRLPVSVQLRESGHCKHLQIASRAAQQERKAASVCTASFPPNPAACLKDSMTAQFWPAIRHCRAACRGFHQYPQRDLSRPDKRNSGFADAEVATCKLSDQDFFLASS